MNAAFAEKRFFVLKRRSVVLFSKTKPIRSSKRSKETYNEIKSYINITDLRPASGPGKEPALICSKSAGSCFLNEYSSAAESIWTNGEEQNRNNLNHSC